MSAGVIAASYVASTPGVLELQDGFNDGASAHAARWRSPGNVVYEAGVFRRNGAGSLWYGRPIRDLITPSDEVVIGCACYHNGFGNAFWFEFLGDSDARHISVGWTTLREIIVVRGDTLATIGTSSYVLPAADNAWHYWELSLKLHDTLGQLIVRVDGVDRYTYNGDTKWAAGSSLVKAFCLWAANGPDLDDFYLVTGSRDFRGDPGAIA